MNYISICAIAKDECKQYMEEFICFHLAIGIEHFYIYDNDSSIPIKQTLKNYIDKGVATVIDFPGRGKQMPAYGHCLSTFNKQSKWIAVVDLDEFIVPKSGGDIKNILPRYETYGALAVNWKMFGSNGHIDKPNGLTIENFTSATPCHFPPNKHIKTIVNTQYYYSISGDPHHFKYVNGSYAVNENISMVKNAFSDHSCNIIQVNHYFTRSLEEFKIKAARTRADVLSNEPCRQLQEFYDLDGCCFVKDESALKYRDKTIEYMGIYSG